jgi:hypothetical protein
VVRSSAASDVYKRQVKNRLVTREKASRMNRETRFGLQDFEKTIQFVTILNQIYRPKSVLNKKYNKKIVLSSYTLLTGMFNSRR